MKLKVILLNLKEDLSYEYQNIEFCSQNPLYSKIISEKNYDKTGSQENVCDHCHKPISATQKLIFCNHCKGFELFLMFLIYFIFLGNFHQRCNQKKKGPKLKNQNLEDICANCAKNLIK